jgi:hypothetical protein
VLHAPLLVANDPELLLDSGEASGREVTMTVKARMMLKRKHRRQGNVDPLFTKLAQLLIDPGDDVTGQLRHAQTTILPEYSAVKVDPLLSACAALLSCL